MNFLIILFFAIILDLIGELPTRIHPVVWIGKTIDFLYVRLPNKKISGVIITFLTSILYIIPLYFIAFLPMFLQIILYSIILSSTFSIKLLIKYPLEVKKRLDDIESARKKVSEIVSRDTSELSRTQIISAAIESLSENIVDSVVSPIFYALFFGIYGAVFYRVVNTLDAMIGYKNKEYREIGWFPAKLDDILNFIPARITGMLIVFASLLLNMDWRNSFKIMLRDSKVPDSPNAGYPMAATAGALQAKLEKPDHYVLGDDGKLNENSIDKAVRLAVVSIILYLAIVSALFSSLITYKL
ncbi:cobalamin biosynthesis protein CobD [Methanothermus fervidus DSM 2088]|uniref:Probable cobalamin biosynthesis protein CobD n=1 Tax=Methanothermus fervidus (strain ATCC 43054 / DSM 2088 / JCM 10308 / V24 S) TaxID=523846 RepID=E3GWE8_METFV|nr:cobalamin biosynthesis protein [Methanothermus fervidus]ADP77913.1 cobalamin biosynthesis protein CobD [Methanothermus fervidus DSM 2088]